MSNLQLSVIVGAILLLIALFSFGRRQPLHKKGAEQAEASAALTDAGILAEARTRLDSTQRQWMATLEQQRSEAAATNIAQEIEVLKLLSRTWNEWGYFTVGGFYAEQIAQMRPNGEAWSIAGTTYGIAFNKTEDAAVRSWAVNKAVNAFRQAASLEPDTLRHQINEAVMLLDLSTVDASVMPMVGVNKLKTLDAAHPNNIAINMTLGRLSLRRSGDVEKALPRFEKVVELSKSDTVTVELETLIEAHYSLAECFQQLKQRDKVLYHFDQCIALAPDDALREKITADKKAYEKVKVE